MWNRKLPDDLPKEIECRFCGEPKQLLQLNDRIAFWVHLNIEKFRQCKKLTFRTSFIRNIVEMYRKSYENMKFHQQQKNGENDGLGSSED